MAWILPSSCYLQSLDLSGLKLVSDVTLDWLRDKPLLTSLSVEQCNVTNVGLAKLSMLTSLTHFSIGWYHSHYRYHSCFLAFAERC
jgi:hypothetical protein